MSDPTVHRPRTGRLFAFAFAVCVVAGLTLGPARYIAPLRWAFLSTLDALTAPIYSLFPLAQSDQVMNVILFAPLGAALAMILPRRAWWAAILACTGLSATVEFFQIVIPGRVSDGTDVVWNTVGAVVGVSAITLARMLIAAIQRRSVTRT